MAQAGAFNYSKVFEFEKKWNEEEFHLWLQRNVQLSWLYSIAYVIGIFGCKWYMDRRERFNLQMPLAVWSGILAIFSILGTLRMWPELIHVLRVGGLYHSICICSFVKVEVTAFWAGLFTLSKVFELGDTVFIVLRKQPLIFLHWYHHITVLLYVWYSYADHTAPGRWFITMNYTVHAFMYSYYTLRALRYRLPTWLKKFITSLQLVQMIVGCCLNAYSYNLKKQGISCQQSDGNLLYSTLMYFSYFVLFAKFYYDAYVNPQPLPMRKSNGPSESAVKRGKSKTN